MKLRIVGKTKCYDSLTRTIRFRGELYDKIENVAERNGITFNNVVNQLVEYALKNLI